MKTTAFLLSMLVTTFLSGVAAGEQKPTAGYAPVNGLKFITRSTAAASL